MCMEKLTNIFGELLMDTEPRIIKVCFKIGIGEN